MTRQENQNRVRLLEELTAHAGWREVLVPAFERQIEQLERDILEGEDTRGDHEHYLRLRKERRFLRRLIAEPDRLTRDIEKALAKKK